MHCLNIRHERRRFFNRTHVKLAIIIKIEGRVNACIILILNQHLYNYNNNYFFKLGIYFLSSIECY